MPSWFPRPSRDASASTSRTLLGGLAALIVVVFLAGVVAAFTTDEGKSGPDDAAAKQAEAERQRLEEERKRQSEANLDAAQRAEADKRAFDLIRANQDACDRKYVPEAEARASAALDQVREQEAALNEVLNALPPGKAKDTLAAQIKPDVEASTELINAELRAARTRCQLAFTIYQYTRETTVPPP